MRQFSHLFLVMVLFLGGCVSPPTGPQHPVDLNSQLLHIVDITQWQLNGKLAYKSPNETFSASMRWNSNQDDFNFRLSNPLGIALVSIAQQGNVATITADGESHEGQFASELIYQQTGLPVPVEPLQSWIKGLPLRGDSYTLNDKGLLATLEGSCETCLQWQVSYGAYMQVSTKNGTTVWLPRAITLIARYQPETKIKIRINKWTLQ